MTQTQVEDMAHRKTSVLDDINQWTRFQKDQFTPPVGPCTACALQEVQQHHACAAAYVSLGHHNEDS
jgi:hypothetical protein